MVNEPSVFEPLKSYNINYEVSTHCKSYRAYLLHSCYCYPILFLQLGQTGLSTQCRLRSKQYDQGYPFCHYMCFFWTHHCIDRSNCSILLILMSQLIIVYGIYLLELRKHEHTMFSDSSVLQILRILSSQYCCFPGF